MHSELLVIQTNLHIHPIVEGAIEREVAMAAFCSPTPNFNGLFTEQYTVYIHLID
jgi:hypothetical protein